MKIMKKVLAADESTSLCPSWIATVVFYGRKPSYSFGERVPTGKGEWILWLDAEPGEIVCIGRNKLVHPSIARPEFYVVDEQGDLQYIGCQDDAYEFWGQQREPAPAPVEKDYTVLLLYPNPYVEETYLAHVTAASVAAAQQLAKEEGYRADVSADDFAVLAVFEGHLDDLKEDD